jgi:hypothetical protein
MDNKIEKMLPDDIISEVTTLEKKIAETKISDKSSYDSMNDIFKMLNMYKKRVIEEFEPKKKKAYQAYKEWDVVIKKYTDPIDKLMSVLKSKLGAYIIEQDRIREEARQAEIRKQEEQRLKDAKVLEEQGCPEAADTLISKRITVSSDVAPKIEKGGTFVTTRWAAEVTSLKALIMHCLEKGTYEEFLTPNHPALNKLATQLKKEGEIMPGVRGVKSSTVGFRG